MPLATGPEPRNMFLVSFVSTSDDKTLGVIIHDVSPQLDGFRQLADRDQDFTVLRDIGMALSGTIEPDQLTERIYEETFRIIPSRNIYIAFYDRASDTVSFPRYVEDGEWHELKSRPFGNGITEYVMRSGQPLLLAHDVEAQAHELGIEPIGRPCMSWIGAPMVADGEVIGVIALQDYEVEDAFNEHHLEILSVVATQAAAAITNVYLLEAERRTYRELAEAQSRLLESERLRGVTETVGALNHEINNPLAAIAGNAQLLLKRKDELKKDSTQKVEAILEATRRIQRVTGKMATLIQATTIPYPGKQEIIDVENSISSQDAAVPVSADVDEALDTEV
jgi:GAF domain-containing protein